MEVDKELVRKMGELSRVKLSEAEIARLEKEFGEIFGYFSSISGIGAKGEQLFYVGGVRGQLRADDPKPKSRDEADAIVENFAQKDGRLLVAPKSLD
ncbi:Aspartyl/glutamyl-tRNA(Asn/Gln) amidotransferase subunit C [uncultured archaeon]|nr:Aspartyl/glutamyl-tRNA(Asn/Gln) amidotransferase subunit C [uncultured archaeon]